VTAARRPFVDRPVGDVGRATELAGVVARSLRLQPPELMRVGMNALYRAGDVVIRVGRPSAPARLGVELARRLHDLDIAAAVPAAHDAYVEGELAATCWVRLVATDAPVDWREVGRIVHRVHALTPSDLPNGYPLPPPTSFPWWDFAGLLADVGPDIDGRARAGLEVAIERNAGWDHIDPAAAVICHGDVHPGNVVMTARGPVLLDWDLMCEAPPGWDHAALLTLAERWGGAARAYLDFAAGYGRSLADDVTARRFAELRNVAATLMRVRAGRTDPAARAEAERRLRYWRGEPDAPQWRAQ
jgi:Ser/Thr protein kinase RdoA (MazF antagonist)